MNATISRLVAALAAGLILISLGSCLSLGSGTGGFGRPKKVGGDSAYAAPASFLHTDNKALRDWLDARFDVTYRNMRLGGTERENVFAQKPVEEVRYRFQDVGRSRKLFHLQADDISRREILYQIAKDYDLRMTVAHVEGSPAYVEVRGKHPGSRFDPGEVLSDEGAVREL